MQIYGLLYKYLRNQFGFQFIVIKVLVYKIYIFKLLVFVFKRRIRHSSFLNKNSSILIILGVLI